MVKILLVSGSPSPPPLRILIPEVSNGTPGLHILVLNSGTRGLLRLHSDSLRCSLTLVIQVNEENRREQRADSLAGPGQHADPAARSSVLLGS